MSWLKDWSVQKKSKYLSVTCLWTKGLLKVLNDKVEIFLEQREVAFLSPSKIGENLNFSTEIQIFANFAGW